MSQRAESIAENLRSIMETPEAILPTGPARRWLFVSALRGADVYVYQAAGSGVYNVWITDARLCLEPQGDETESEFARWWRDRFPGVPLVEGRASA